MKNKLILRTVCNPDGLAELAAVQVPVHRIQPLQRGAASWFKTGRITLALAAVLVASVCLLPSSHAGITFQAGTEYVSPGGLVSVPITVSVTSDLASKTWLNAGCDLTWNSGALVLQPTAVTANGSPFTLDLTIGGLNFNSPSAGELDFGWYGSGTIVPNGSTLFTVNFQANLTNTVGSNIPITFASVDTILFNVITGDSATPTSSNGSINVVAVPEPVNWALGLFACLFTGSATIRWISRLGPMGSKRSQLDHHL